MNKTILKLTELIHRALENNLSGKCYIASEALYHLAGGKSMGFTPQVVRVNGITHWYLKLDDDIVDITAAQFDHAVDYSNGIGKGFLTKKPSKKAQRLINTVKEML